jgi:hypothetical protein
MPGSFPDLPPDYDDVTVLDTPASAPNPAPTPAPAPAPAPAPGSRLKLEPWKKRDLKIIVVGETGVGKTCFMSYVYNMCQGRSLEEFENHFDKNVETGGSGAESQTNIPKPYYIPCADGPNGRRPGVPPQTVTILDTPGLGDTRGIDHDNEHKKIVAETIKKKLQTVDAVIIMANGTQERLGITTQYALENIYAMFPRSLVKNIGFLFSNCDRLHLNFEMSSLPEELRESEHWLFQNPLALWNKYKAVKDRGGVSEDQLEEMRDEIDMAYNKGLRFLNKFFKWLDERPVQPSKDINDLYEKLNGIDKQITNVMA